MKKYTNKILVLIISGFIVLAITLQIITTSIQKSSGKSNSSTSGQLSKQSKTEQTQLTQKEFDSINIEGSLKIKISQGNYIVQTQGTNKELTMYIDDKVLHLISHNSENTLYIQMPQIKTINASTSEIIISNFKSSPADIPLNITLTGSTNLAVKQSTFTNIDLKSSGATNIIFNNCNLRYLTLNVSGASNIYLNTFVNGSLEGKVSGVSNIEYGGNLLTNNLNLSGLVEVNHSH